MSLTLNQSRLNTSPNMMYLKYLLKHKWYVFIECCKLGIPLRGLLHDLSKFLPSEWIPYREYFYGDSSKEYVLKELKFEVAWAKHQNRNKHHWQHWVLIKDNGDVVSLPMPMKYVKEMLADWRGAGKAITGKDNTKSWYLKNKDNIILHPIARHWIEEQLGVKFKGALGLKNATSIQE